MSKNKFEFSGARWWKFDFHSHTPKSFDYGRDDETLKNITAEKWLLNYMRTDIDCIVITDHNSGEFIDDIKTAYQNLKSSNTSEFRELYIFPGVEISGNSGVHILAILDISKSNSDIASLLGRCGYSGNFGESNTCTTKSVTEVITEINNADGIPILAHIDDTKGLFKEISDGNTLKKILSLEQLYAAEITTSKYIVKSENHDKNVIPQLYYSEKTNWSFVSGSDSHRPAEIGKRWTWVKMGTPSLEGLKLALLDRDLSIKRFDEYPDNPNIYSQLIIKNLEIKNSKYCGNGNPLKIDFSPWLNCIIGGCGTGKSTIIEFLRVVFRRTKELEFAPKLKQIFDDFLKIPDNRNDKGILRENTEIISNSLKDENDFLLQWSNTGSLASIKTKNENGEFIDSQGDIYTRFPIRIYSQKQIFEMADSPEALLKIIDDSPEITFREWQETFRQQCAKYRSLKTKIREFSLPIKNEKNILGELEDIKKKISIFENGQNSEILKKYQRIISEEKEVTAFEQSIQDNIDLLKNIIIELISPNQDIIDKSNYADELKKIILDFTSLSSEYNKELTDLKSKLDLMLKNFTTKIEASQWKSNVENIKKEYEKFVDELKKLGIENPNEYGLLIQSKQNAERKLKQITDYKKIQSDLEKQSKELFENIIELRKEITKKRNDFVSSVLTNNRYVKIEIKECGDKKNLENEFRSLLNKESGFDDDILSANSDDGILNHLYNQFSYKTLEELKKLLRDIKNDTADRTPKDRRFYSYIQEKVSEEMFDDIELWFPQDSVEILYLRDNSNYIPIDQGSPGQKTAAILAFILSYGTEPIILDQPEDDLDNHLITDLVVKQIRENKKRRQIIIVTHNPNIVVNGDAEKVMALDFQHGQIQITSVGCLQEKKLEMKYA